MLPIPYPRQAEATDAYSGTGWQPDVRQHQDFRGLGHPDYAGPRSLSGSTFEGYPFHVELSSDNSFDTGASAHIYKGRSSGPWDQQLVVAVKLFGQMLRPHQRELLVRELRTSSQVALCHPRILEFLGTASVGGQTALVSLYMKNGNLLEYVRHNPHCDKKNLLVQVAEAVTYLHSDVGLVHGDLKCQNVLVSDQGNALLADFGLSTFVEKSKSAATTMTAIRDMNTVQFAAPELLLGPDDRSVRPRSKTRESDVYAFGMLILEAVTELLPWLNQSAITVSLKVCNGQHPPLPKRGGAFRLISCEWWDVCRACWSFQPEMRPTMGAILKALNDSEITPGRLLSGHNGSTLSVVFLPAGDKIVSGSSDRSIRIWEARTGALVVGPLLGHDTVISCVAVSPDGRQFCSASYDSTVRRWDAESGALVGGPMTGHSVRVNSIAYSPDGTRIVSGANDRTVCLWDASTGEAFGTPLEGHTDQVWCVAFSPDGAFIASGSLDNTIRLWDSATGAHLATLERPSGPVESLCFSPDRIHLVSGSRDQTVRIWNVAKRRLERTLQGHSDDVTSVAISPSGQYIASGSWDKTIRIWDAHTGEAVGAPLTGHTDWVRSVAFSPDGRSLVSGSNDRTLRIWDLFE
ncbi:WD40 repeat-like protein [Auricularia subglabra TFB-10046 SS5]|nr:WD40 repeat-like protein [Auricularia subglabra TFB-10046 SS5]